VRAGGWGDDLRGLELDGDGRLDWLLTDDDREDALVFVGGRRKRVSLGRRLPDWDVVAARETAIGDLDGDGRVDLAAFDPFGGAAWVALGLGGGRFTAPVRLALDVDAALAADVDDDPADELIVVLRDHTVAMIESTVP
jgi:hypothetical protein